VRLKLDSGPLGNIRTLVESRFASELPSEETLAAAWADPKVRDLFTPANAPRIVGKLQATAVDVFAHVQARVGTSLGVPTQALDDFARSVAVDALDDGVVNWPQFALGGVQAATDIALEAMGAVPIVGWIAKAALVAVNAIIRAVSNDEPRPLLLTYQKSRDEEQAQDAIDRIGSLHGSLSGWNSLFLPSGSGPWVYAEGENGYVVQPRDPGDGFGGVPSGVMGLRSMQVRSWHSILQAVEMAHSYDGVSLDDDPLKSKRVRDVLSRVTEDTFSQLPSLQRVALAAWSAASTNRTAAVFNLHPNGLRSGWRSYVERGLDFVNLYDGGVGMSPTKALALAVRFRLGQQPVEIRMPPGYRLVGGKLIASASRLRLDLITDAWCDFLDARQRELVRSSAVAYCSEAQLAFTQSQPLRNELIANRKLLLTTLDADDVEPADVIDDDFRRELVLYRGPRSGRMPGNPPSTPNNVPPVLVAEHASEGGGGGGFGAAVLAAAALGAAWYAVRGRR
jgi:hypothetical protein